MVIYEIKSFIWRLDEILKVTPKPHLCIFGPVIAFFQIRVKTNNLATQTLSLIHISGIRFHFNLQHLSSFTELFFLKSENDGCFCPVFKNRVAVSLHFTAPAFCLHMESIRRKKWKPQEM